MKDLHLIWMLYTEVFLKITEENKLTEPKKASRQRKRKTGVSEHAKVHIECQMGRSERHKIEEE